MNFHIHFCSNKHLDNTCCSLKVVAIGFNTLCYDAERRGINPSARIKK